MIAIAALAFSAIPVNFIVFHPAAAYDYICRIRTPEDKASRLIARVSGPEDKRVADVQGDVPALTYGSKLPVRLSENGLIEGVNIEREGKHFSYIFDSRWGKATVVNIVALDLVKGYPFFEGVGFCNRQDVEPEGPQK